MRLNGDSLEEVDYFKYLGRKWQRTEDVEHRMNEVDKVWGALKGVICDIHIIGDKYEDVNMKE